MADLPDDLERLKNIAADLRARLARIEDRIRRLEDARWREFQKERAAALGVAVPAAHHHEAWWLIEATAPPRPLYYTGPCRHPTAYRTIAGTTEDAERAARYPTEEAAKLTVALMLGIDTTEPTWPLRVVNSGWKVAEHIFDYTPRGVPASQGGQDAA